MFSTPIENGELELKTHISTEEKRYRPWNHAPQKLGTCQSQKSFAIGLPNTVTKIAYSSVCDPHMNPARIDTLKKHLRNCYDLT